MHFRPRLLWCKLFTRFVWVVDFVWEDCVWVFDAVGVDCAQMVILCVCGCVEKYDGDG